MHMEDSEESDIYSSSMLQGRSLSMSDQNRDDIALLQLDISEVLYLQSLLPKRYSLQLAQNLQNEKQAPTNPQFAALINNIELKPSYKMVKRKLLPMFGLVQSLKKSKYSLMFRYPVDPIALRLPDYRKIVKRPMDLHTIHYFLLTGIYDDPAQVHRDIKLMVNNAYRYNQPNRKFFMMAVKFKLFYLRIKSKFQDMQELANKKKPRQESTKRLKYRRTINPTVKMTRQNRQKTCQMFKSLSKDKQANAIKFIQKQVNIKSKQLDFSTLPQPMVRKLYYFFKTLNKGEAFSQANGQEPQEEAGKMDEQIIENIENDQDYDD